MDGGMVSIFPLGSCCKSDDVLRFHLPHHLLKGKRRQMVTLVNNHLTIFCHEVFYPFLAVGALKNRNIYTVSAFGRPSPYLPNYLCGNTDNHPQSPTPLHQQLFT